MKVTQPLQLNRLQEAAVKAQGKNILVSAGAGTGKTRVLVERFLHFVTTGQAQVTDILALTFTEKAANEMKKRILDRCGELGLEGPRRSFESAYISTLHAFAARLLREHPVEAGVDPDFRVIESIETVFLKDQVLENLFETHCRAGTELFELLRVYGEGKIRSGLLAVHEAARQSGQTLEEFFSALPARDEAAELLSASRVILENLRALEEKETAEGWERLLKESSWTWETVEKFRLWRQGFSRKRGKKGESYWPEVKRAADEYLAVRMEAFAKPWREKFEKLALLFEGSYEARKRERGFLDFEDLEIRAVRLFSRATPVHAKLLGRYREKFKHILIDEFQDTNALQMKLISLLSSGNNLFFVGDYKQSIYAFRGAEPSLFLEREREHKVEDGPGAFIPLYENFRTAPGVLNFVNSFFSRLWEEEGFKFEPLEACGKHTEEGAVELLVVRPEERESLDSARMREAELIAERMLSLREQGIPYGHMAVLFQAMTHVALYEQALKKRGIPSYVMSGGGFYHQPEIRDMISYLGFLENPLADIPLAAALRSPLFQVRDNTLFWIADAAKAADRERGPVTPLFYGVEKVLQSGVLPEEEMKKVRFFQTVTAEMLGLKDRLKLTELLDLILERTSYELTMLADPQGARRYANLRKLMNLARQFEVFEPLPLGAFLQAVKRLETQGVRESEAQIEAEAGGEAVRLLTIHRSKGLEFEAVFAADLGRERQSPDTKTILADSGRGYAMQIRNETSLDWENPAGWNETDERLTRKDKEEWKRLLYVAMTRAKTRLVLSGVYKEKKKEKELFSDMSSWMDWLMCSELENVRVAESVQADPVSKKKSLAEKSDLKKSFGDFDAAKVREKIPAKAKKAAAAEAQALLKSLERLPPSPSRVIHLPVSAYAAYAKSPLDYWRAYEVGISEDIHEKPAEIVSASPDESPSPADFGTAMHRALELLDFRKADDEALDRVAREAFRAFSPAVQKEGRVILEAFRGSALFSRLASSRRLLREIPFILRERHGLIHGVIDVLFQEGDGRWHVLDYKTAAGSDEKLLSSGYETQIKLYAHAVYQILGAAPASGILYFLKNDWQHEVLLGEKDYGPLELEVRALQDSILKCSGREVFK